MKSADDLKGVKMRVINSQLPVTIPDGFLRLATSRGKPFVTRLSTPPTRLKQFSKPVTIPVGLIWLSVSGETVSLATCEEEVFNDG